jgi:hypothetical protein
VAGRGPADYHFLRIVRGILLKGNGIRDVVSEIWPIALSEASYTDPLSNKTTTRTDWLGFGKALQVTA